MAIRSLARDKLEQQLTCAVCLEIYVNPKTLPCLHSFCLHCLERLPSNIRQNKYYIICPTCRTSFELPEPAGATRFPAAFHLNNLMEVHSLMKKKSDHQLLINIQQKSEPYDHQQYCSKHDDPLKVYCETCQVPICRDCTIGEHRGHEYVLVKDCYKKHHQMLETSLGPVKKMLSDIEGILNDLTRREDEIKKQTEAVKEEIHAAVEGIIDVLRQSERQLTKEVEIVCDNKLLIISSQKKSAELSLSELKDCKEFVEQTLKIGSQQKALMFKKQMMERMSQVIKEVNVEKHNSLEGADIHFIKGKNEIVPKQHMGFVRYKSLLPQCKVKKIKRHQIAHLNEAILFPLSMELPNSLLLTVPLSSLSCSVVSSDNTPISTTITGTGHSGVYKIQYSPIMNGPHQVNVQINNVKLGSTSLIIPFNPYLDNVISTFTIEGVNSPLGIAVSNDGHVIVTENNGDCITIVDKIGKKVKSFTSSRLRKIFSSPRGIAVTSDNLILVTDDHKVQKLTMDGKLVASVGKLGSKSLEFNQPHGIGICPITEQIYIADTQNHRIQVLNPDLTFAYSFGSKGSGLGQFSSPRFITIDNQELYVSDSGNHRIQKFSPEGKFTSHFGTSGSGSGQLQSPNGTVIYNNLLYIVEEGNDRVSIFTTEGTFVNSFGGCGHNKDQLFLPHGITFDSEGYLYICDLGNKRLVIY